MSSLRGNVTGAEQFARAAAAVVGVTFLLVGVLGFVPGITTDYDSMTFADHESGAELLGIFQVSILHNIVHLLFGVAGLWAATQARLVAPVLLGSAAIYGLLTIYGIVIDKESDANFVPLNSADNWLHLVLTVGLAGLGLYVKKRLDDSGIQSTT
ncbi:MAG: hypothetical protein QOH68_100 [Nocardioidaceae bacterium]|jgi:hypothetical protein|nr:hypothetical protein [Nocardioidaceae bacterium]